MAARSIRKLLSEMARRREDAPAVLAPGREALTYGGLIRQVEEVVGALNAMGIGRGDRVGIVLGNGPELAVAFLGVACGATSAPLNPAYREAEFNFYLDDMDAKAAVVEAGVESPAREVCRQRGIAVLELEREEGGQAGRFRLRGAAGDVSGEGMYSSPKEEALVLHTSGTTSRPKMAPLSHWNVCASADNIGRALRLTEGDRCLNVMPLFHIHGLMAATLATLASGGSVVCTPGFYAPEFFGWMDAHEPTWYTAVPTMHQAILTRADENADVIARRPLRFVRSSSSSLAPSVMEALEAAFAAPVIEAYGMTEASHQMTSNPLPPGKGKPGSVGVAAGPEVAIMEEGLAGLWREVLKVARVGVHEHFLDVGGDSILAGQLLARVRERTGVAISMIDFFDAATVAEQARLVETLLLDEIEGMSEEDVLGEAGKERHGGAG